MEKTENFVAYIVAPTKKKNSLLTDINEFIATQESTVKKFIQQKNGQLTKIFIELGDNRRSRHPWPELESAIAFAIASNAHLVISEINHLTANTSFTEQIFKFIDHASTPNATTELQLYCCDQAYIQLDNFKAIVAHAKQQRKFHGQLIKEGLKRSHSKSGNPNAIHVINKVNKPKIDNAIVFSLILAPVISAYRLQGLSQRKMVSRLNEEGFTAPEGGLWVLSQLQKVIYRITVNETALSLEHQCSKLRELDQTTEEIAEQFNKLSISCPFQDNKWLPENIVEIEERAKLIHEILELHEFILTLTPILEKYHVDELNEDVFANELQSAGIEIPETFYRRDPPNNTTVAKD